MDILLLRVRDKSHLVNCSLDHLILFRAPLFELWNAYKCAVRNRWVHLRTTDDSQTYLHHHLSLSLPAGRRSAPSSTSSPNHVWPSVVWRTARTAPQWSTVTTAPFSPGPSTTSQDWGWLSASTSVPLITFCRLLSRLGLWAWDEQVSTVEAWHLT